VPAGLGDAVVQGDSLLQRAPLPERLLEDAAIGLVQLARIGPVCGPRPGLGRPLAAQAQPLDEAESLDHRRDVVAAEVDSLGGEPEAPRGVGVRDAVRERGQARAAAAACSAEQRGSRTGS